MPDPLQNTSQESPIQGDAVQVGQSNVQTVQAQQAHITQSGIRSLEATEVHLENVGCGQMTAEQVTGHNCGIGMARLGRLEASNSNVGMALAEEIGLQDTQANVLIGRQVHGNVQAGLVLSGKISGDVHTALNTPQVAVLGILTGLTMAAALWLLRNLGQKQA
ncbi:MAG: hypothetical protein Fur0018_16700 [Anaerolineales bacterium]